jgi:hypothetical protein
MAMMAKKKMWIVAAYYEDRPEKIWQLGIFSTKKAAQELATKANADNHYHWDDDVIVVIFEAEIVETMQ